MRVRRSLVLASSLLGVLAVSASLAQQGPALVSARPTWVQAKPLDLGTVAVRLILGLGDLTPADWSGRVRVDKGEIVDVEGLRFRQGDEVTARDAWRAHSVTIRKTPQKAAGKKAAQKVKAAQKAKAAAAAVAKGGPGNTGPTVAPNGVVVTLKDAATATLTVETSQGNFAVPLDRLSDGSVVRLLDGRAVAQLTFPHAPLREGPRQEDFPSAAADGAAGAWVAYVVHDPRGPEVLEALSERPRDFAEFAPKGGGDQVQLVRFQGGKAGEPLDVTAPGRDVWRPAVATSREGILVVWSEFRDGNWDLFGRRYDPGAGTFAAEQRLTDQPGTDTGAVLATAADGRVWMAWQSWANGQSDILLAPAEPGAAPVKITDTPANEWAPSIAADKSGRVHVAFDSYQSGNYDVLLRTREADGTTSAPVVVAGSAAFEARPSLAVDSRGRAWIAYEAGPADWGKDAQNLLVGKGSTLYRASKIVVACVDGQRVLRAPDPVAAAPQQVRLMNSFPRLAIDQAGRPWLAFRHRQEVVWGNNAVMVVGGVWVEHATALSGSSWSVPRALTRSDGLLDNRPALVQPGEGPVLAFYATDGRLRREVEMTKDLQRRYYSHSGTPPGVFNMDLEVTALSTAAPFEEPRLSQPEGPATPSLQAAAAPPATASVPAAAVHPNELEDLRRVRAYRIEHAGKTYRLLRGEFHRHCEISQDGGSDGPFEDLWRYALDAAQLDWIGDGDHDNGGGKEYTWWLVQKATDIYHLPPTFVPMFCYERSIAYPHGHRNVMFAQRGVRTLPRLVGPAGVIDDDTPMLYDYLKEHNGICASHTSATGMGTDWRDVNPEFEPFVEIYQGHRQSYEYLGAPRSARGAGESIGGWQPLGMVWNALAMQYRLGFQASSDHISTHISYAVALAEDTTREAILDAFRRRHCYAATDNIIMDVRSGDHLMGDEFNASGPVSLSVSVFGTRPLARVDIIKDFKFVYSTEPRTQRVSFQWTDDEPDRPAGLSWYYVRAIQDDGELAWASPIWVHTNGSGGDN
jgi:hypothetical protein